jgi:hypothetical protein
MANHFAAIGFDVWDQDGLDDLANEAIRRSDPIRVPGGDYYRWAPGGGAEVWVQVVGREWLGLTPHFVGRTALPTGILARVARPEDTPLEGCLHAWANPRDGGVEEGDYPFIFAVPDFRALDRVQLPLAAPVQVAAFAHDLDLYPSEDAYVAALENEGLKLAPESFIPAGMFTEEGEAPEPVAIITGRVQAAERRMNPAGGSFWWMQVRTLGGEMDVVAEEELIVEPPTVGGIVTGEFYLSGRVTGIPAARRPRWRGVARR